MIKGRNILLCTCGGVAVYKAVEVASRLKKLDAEIDVIMTENSTKFVAPLTFRSITHRPVITDMFEKPVQWDIQHISLANKAEIVVIAPATANIIGKIAGGIADDMLTTTVMATKAPVLIVPAMNFNMYSNPIVQQNIEKLRKLGYIFMEPETGRMAEGSSGKGRLPEPAKIVEKICEILCNKPVKNDFKDRKVLVTAGPTREAIDPVRYISNRSSGKMGYAIAGAAVERGAQVRLISGPVSISPPDDVELVRVVTAEEMRDAVIGSYKDYDIIIMVAAVSDYKCAEVSDIKIKKKDEGMTIRLVKNPDILKELGEVKGDRLLVGACAETNDLIENAMSKIKAKNLDMIIANDVTMEGAGFEVDTNIIKLIKRDGSIRELPLMSKKDAANEILDEISKMLAEGISKQ